MKSKKFFNKLSKSSKVSELKMIDDNSFSFRFEEKFYTIAYHSDSLCMIINEGLGNPFTSSASEIGFYELENYF